MITLSQGVYKLQNYHSCLRSMWFDLIFLTDRANLKTTSNKISYDNKTQYEDCEKNTHDKYNFIVVLSISRTYSRSQFYLMYLFLYLISWIPGYSFIPFILFYTLWYLMNYLDRYFSIFLPKPLGWRRILQVLSA